MLNGVDQENDEMGLVRCSQAESKVAAFSPFWPGAGLAAKKRHTGGTTAAKPRVDRTTSLRVRATTAGETAERRHP